MIKLTNHNLDSQPGRVGFMGVNIKLLKDQKILVPFKLSHKTETVKTVPNLLFISRSQWNAVTYNP